jgi:hypothetical protein
MMDVGGEEDGKWSTRQSLSILKCIKPTRVRESHKHERHTFIDFCFDN